MARRINALIIEFDSRQELYRVIAKIAVNTLLLSNSIRRDTTLRIIILKTKEELVLEGGRIRNLRPDEESSIGLIKSFFKKKLVKKITSEHSINIDKPCIEYNCTGRLLEEELKKLCLSRGFTIVYPEDNGYIFRHCKDTIRIPYITSIVEAVVIGGLMLDWCEWRGCFGESL